MGHGLKVLVLAMCAGPFGTSNAQAEDVPFAGSVVTYSDHSSGTLGLPDLTGAPMAISLSLPETCSIGFVPVAATPLTVGGFSIEFTGNQWSCGASFGAYSFYLAPYDGILISGPGMLQSYRADGVFQVDVDGNLSWSLGIYTYGVPTSALARLSGTARVASVQDPATLLSQLATDVAGVGTGTSLADKLAIVQAYLAVPDIQSACLTLDDFNNQVRAQRGKRIAPAVADQLTADADSIKTAIPCP